MAARFKLTDGARDDLTAIVDYTLKEWGAAQAGDYLDMLELHMQMIAEQPLLGVARPDLADSLRSFPAESHILYYLPEPSGVVIVRVLHSRQDPMRHL